MSYRTLTQFLENFNCSIILIHARINNRGLFGWWLEKGAWARQTSEASNFLDTWGHDLLPGQANACQASIWAGPRCSTWSQRNHHVLAFQPSTLLRFWIPRIGPWVLKLELGYQNLGVLMPQELVLGVLNRVPKGFGHFEIPKIECDIWSQWIRRTKCISC